MDREAKAVPEPEFQLLLTRYLETAEELRKVVLGTSRDSANSNKYAWSRLISVGRALAEAILASRDIPQHKADAFTEAAHLFLTATRTFDIAKWYEKNRGNISYLEIAAKTFPPKEAEENLTDDTSKGTFKVGPFTVHNTFGLLSADLVGPVAALNAATQAIHGSLKTIPGFEKVLYGDVFLVGLLGKMKRLAWYDITKDELFLRTDITGRGHLHSVTHELAHRYWRKFMSADLKHKFLQRDSVCRYDSPSKIELPPLPKVGDPIGFEVKGSPTQPKVRLIQGDKLMLSGGEFFRISDWVRIMQENRSRDCFPTGYASTNPEEHFCDVMGLKASGKLTGEHMEAFEQIFGGAPVPAPAPAVAQHTAAVVTIGKSRYSWKRDASDVWRSDAYRGWRLEGTTGQRDIIAFVTHTLGGSQAYTPTEPPAWKIMIRVPATPEERGNHGTFKSIYLKQRFPSPKGGQENLAQAQAMAVKAYEHFMKDREHLKVGSDRVAARYLVRATDR